MGLDIREVQEAVRGFPQVWEARLTSSWLPLLEGPRPGHVLTDSRWPESGIHRALGVKFAASRATLGWALEVPKVDSSVEATLGGCLLRAQKHRLLSDLSNHKQGAWLLGPPRLPLLF